MRWMNSIVAVLLAVSLVMVDLPASAKDSFLIETEETIPIELEEAVGGSCDNDIFQGIEATSEEIQTGELTQPDVDVTDGIIACGKDGDITWVIDADGKLTVEGTGDLSGDHESSYFAWKPYSDQITSVVVNVTGMTDASYLFIGCENMTSIDISGFDTGSVADMGCMFYGCSGLANLDISGLDTGNVQSMDLMFAYCSGLTNLNINGLDTGNVQYMDAMFLGCSSLTSLDIGELNTESVLTMNSMFSGCSSLTNLDISGLDTCNVVDMEYMFSECSSLTYLDMRGLDFGNVQGVNEMFSGCSGLTTIYSPCNVMRSVRLPNVPGTTWQLPDGTRVTELPKLKYSATLTRQASSTPSPAPAMPTPSPAMPTPTPSPVTPTPAPATPTPAPEAPSPIPVPTSVPDETEQVQNFVLRMYTVALGREAEAAGLYDWTNRLITHEIDGAGIANGFIMSNEFKNRNLSNEDYVDTLYRTFFDREADQRGRANWLSELASGKSRSYVLAGFVNSAEFDNLCDVYGIARGTMREEGSPVNAGIRQFVERCYTKVLGRPGEKAGVEDWTNRIATGQMSAENVAKSFFFSDEYTNKNTTNETFVETLYQTFMGRDSDPAGKSDWVGRLDADSGRQEVLEGFSRSEEFAAIRREYGL